MGSDAADLCRLRGPHRRGQGAAEARRRPERAVQVRSTSARKAQLDRAARALQQKILEATVPKGQKPTASQLQASIQAARELLRSGKVPPPDPNAHGGAGAQLQS